MTPEHQDRTSRIGLRLRATRKAQGLSPKSLSDRVGGAPSRVGPARKKAVPPELTSHTAIPSLPDLRYRVGLDNVSLLREGIASVRREQAHLASWGHHGPLPPAVFLAVSGERRVRRRSPLLPIGTVDLGARQAVIGNMTKIAASRDPRALNLFQSITIASAAIPGAFPPVMIDVEANGMPYQEMHVDGGTMSQVSSTPQRYR